MTQIETLRLALEFITSINPAFTCEAIHHSKKERHASNEPCPHVAKQKQVYEAIKAALEAKDEPWESEMRNELVALGFDGQCPESIGITLKRWRDWYASAQRTWVGLTDEDKQKLAAEQHNWESLCFAVEAKLKEKNT